MKQRISRLLSDITPHIDELNHHLCDAAVAAYTTFLHLQGRTELIGDAKEGTIHLPLVDNLVCTS